jgi:hypothetical protein
MRFGGTTTAITVGGAAPTLPPEEETIGPEDNPESDDYGDSDTGLLATPAGSEVSGLAGSSPPATAYGAAFGLDSDSDFDGGYGSGNADPAFEPSASSEGGGEIAAAPSRVPLALQARLAALPGGHGPLRFWFGLIGFGSLAMVASSVLWRRKGVGVT